MLIHTLLSAGAGAGAGAGRDSRVVQGNVIFGCRLPGLNLPDGVLKEKLIFID